MSGVLPFRRFDFWGKPTAAPDFDRCFLYLSIFKKTGVIG
jgi:hypothetical protein